MAISLRLPAEIESRLSALADSTGRSKTFYAIQAITQHLDDLEDAYMADIVVERINSGQEKTISLSNLMVEYDLAN